MIYHMIAFGLGFCLDLLLGDPYWLPHPIRVIGNFIGILEKRMNKKECSEKYLVRAGIGMVALVLLTVLMVTALLLILAYRIHPVAGVILEMIMTYQILAAKCLKVESMKVYNCLKENDLIAARHAVSMIVGRDTERLDETGVAKAAIETVAENTSDGVIAPMLYTALGGPVLGFFYKAVNTMDSMVGYKNERYLHFGRAAAKFDDICNYIPSRISAYLMIAGTYFLGKEYDGKHAYYIYKRDRYHHASPNSAQTEAVCAGALSIQLAGDAWYFGKLVKKPFIGDALRPVEYEDIRRANRLLFATAFLCEGICLLVIGLLFFI